MKFFVVAIFACGILAYLFLMGYFGALSRMIPVTLPSLPIFTPVATHPTISSSTKASSSPESTPKSTTTKPLPPPAGFMGPTGQPFVVGPSGPPPQ